MELIREAAGRRRIACVQGTIHGGETVNGGTKFIIREIAQQQVGQHIEKQFL